MNLLESAILTSMARTLFVSIYADAVENGELHRLVGEHLGYTVAVVPHGDVADPDPETEYYEVAHPAHPASFPDLFTSEQEAWEAVCDYAKVSIDTPGGGGDWMDLVTDDTPVTCLLECGVAVGEWLEQCRHLQPDRYVSLLTWLNEALVHDRAQELANERMKDVQKPDGNEAWAAWMTQREPTLTEIGNARLELEAGTLDRDDYTVARHGKSYAEDFGHCLAMMGMGHGVSWFDDHADFNLPDFSPWIGGICLEDLGFDAKAYLEAQGVPASAKL